MTRIETIFGGVLALGILGVFAFVFFGGVEAAPREASAPRARVLASATTAALAPEKEEDYAPPRTACECFNLGYDLVRNQFEVGGVDYESQLQVCYDQLSRAGAAAFDAGASAAAEEPRGRRSCRPEDYTI